MRRLLTLRDEAGAVGGYEALPLSILVLVVGTLLIANTWAVIDTKIAVTAAAREAARAYVEAPGPDAALASAIAAARESVIGEGMRISPEVEVAGSHTRCTRIQARVTTVVPAVRLPWVGGLASMRVTSTASEVVDPLRSGIAGEATCLAP